MIKCSTSWLWWWFHRYTQLSKHNNCTLPTGCILQHVNYTPIRFKKKSKLFERNWQADPKIFRNAQNLEKPKPSWKSAVIKVKVISMVLEYGKTNTLVKQNKIQNETHIVNWFSIKPPKEFIGERKVFNKWCWITMWKKEKLKPLCHIIHKM